MGVGIITATVEERLVLPPGIRLDAQVVIKGRCEEAEKGQAGPEVLLDEVSASVHPASQDAKQCSAFGAITTGEKIDGEVGKVEDHADGER